MCVCVIIVSILFENGSCDCEDMEANKGNDTTYDVLYRYCDIEEGETVNG